MKSLLILLLVCSTHVAHADVSQSDFEALQEQVASLESKLHFLEAMMPADCAPAPHRKMKSAGDTPGSPTSSNGVQR